MTNFSNLNYKILKILRKITTKNWNVQIFRLKNVNFL